MVGKLNSNCGSIISGFGSNSNAENWFCSVEEVVVVGKSRNSEKIWSTVVNESEVEDWEQREVVFGS